MESGERRTERFATDQPGAGGELVAPPYRALPGRSELANWAFEGPGYQLITLSVDAILLAIVLVVADAINPADSYLPVLLISPLAVLMLATRHQYDPHAQISRLDIAAAVIGSTAAAALLVAALVQLTHPTATESGLIVIQFAFATALLLVWRMIWATARRSSRRRRLCGRRTLIVGAGAVGATLERHLRELPTLGLIPVGFVDDVPVTPAEAELRRLPVLGTTGEFDAIVDETGAEHAIFAYEVEPYQTLRRLLQRCRDRGMTMAVVPRLFDDTTNRMVLGARRRHPRVRAAPGRPDGLGVRDQARVRPHGRRGGPARAVAGDRHHRAGRQALLPGAGAVPPAAGRARRQGLRRAQVPLDAPGGAGFGSAAAHRRRGAGRRRGRGPPHAGGALHPEVVAGRDPAAVQRPARRHEPGRAAAGAARAGRPLRGARAPLRRAPPGQVGDHRLGAGQRPGSRRPRSPTAPSSTTTTSRTGPCGST